MFRHSFYPALLVGIALAATAAAQDQSIVSKYLTDNTIAGVRVDLKRVDLNALRDKAFEWKVLDPDLDKQMLSGLPFARAFVNGIANAGGDELWVLLDLYGITEGPTLVLTVTAEGDTAAKVEALADTLTALVPQGANQTIRPMKDHILICSDQMMTMYEENGEAGAARDLPAAILADQNQILTAFYAPSADQRRAMQETLPNELPEPFSEINPQALAKAVEHVSLRFAMKPEVSMVANVQASSKAGADEVNAAIGKFAEAATRVPELEKEMPGAANLLKSIPFELRETAVVAEVTEANGQVGKIVDALASPVRAARAAAKRQQSMNNMKQIMLALHNYYDTHRGFPLRATVDENGKQLLSWRVYLLPYLEQANLFQQFHLDEPWDSEHNKQLIEQCPAAFRSPGTADLGPGLSNYVVALADNTFLSTQEPMQFRDITDGTSNTIGIMETDAEHAVIWTKPDDLQVDLKQPLKGLLIWAGDVFLCSRVDGSVQAVSATTDLETLKNLLQYNDGNPVR